MSHLACGAKLTRAEEPMAAIVVTQVGQYRIVGWETNEEVVIMPMEPTRPLRRKPAPIAWLAITAGPGQGRDFRLGAVTSIGRDSAVCDVVLSDETASASHARVRREGKVFVLYNLASLNGTYINEQRIERVLLHDGDKIKVGETTLTFKTA